MYYSNLLNTRRQYNNSLCQIEVLYNGRFLLISMSSSQNLDKINSHPILLRKWSASILLACWLPAGAPFAFIVVRLGACCLL
jgi:hypothetical protein